MFAPVAKLRDRKGKVLNPGGGIREGYSGNMVLFAGDARAVEKDGKTRIECDGETFPVPEGKTVGITGSASAVAVADLDGDNDFDIVAGDIGGNLWLIRNEGTAKAPAFAQPVRLAGEGGDLAVPGGDAGPAVADWDGDGVADLVVGSGDGSVTLFRNGGSAKEFRPGAGTILVPAAKDGWEAQDPAVPRPGVRAKVCVADWNGDGRADLLLGDFANERIPPPETTPERAKEIAEAKKAREDIGPRWNAVVEGVRNAKDPEARAAAKKELERVQAEMEAILAKIPDESAPRGRVWVFLRKAPAATAGK